ncbi:MAG: hypothetical protein R3D25_10090 [Geminicoccaceae bacterium]
MAEVRLRVARERYAKGEIPLKNVEARESEVEAARSALQSAQGGQHELGPVLLQHADIDRLCLVE